MGDFISKIVFLVFVLPALLISDGYGKLKKYLEKRGTTLDPLYLVLAGLIVLLILLLGVGFRF